MQTKKKAASHTAPKKPSYDWATIKDDYLKNNLSLADIERKYGMNHTTISHRANKEGWQRLRDEIATKSQKKTIEKIVEEKSNINDIAMKALRIATEKAMAGLAEVDIHDSRSIKDYMSILKDLRDIGAISIDTEDKEIVVSFKDFDEEGVIE